MLNRNVNYLCSNIKCCKYNCFVIFEKFEDIKMVFCTTKLDEAGLKRTTLRRVQKQVGFLIFVKRGLQCPAKMYA